jgi:hypothetical protein
LKSTIEAAVPTSNTCAGPTSLPARISTTPKFADVRMQVRTMST